MSEWFLSPLYPGAFFPVWSAFALGAFIIVIIAICLCRLRKKKKAASVISTFEIKQERTTTAVIPDSASAGGYTIANIQGIGRRGEQQDTFAVSDISTASECGLLCVMCDGMGGMENGGAVSEKVTQDLLRKFPMGTDDPSGVSTLLRAENEIIYSEHAGYGGTTLVMTYIFNARLWFWCVGDSDLFLARGSHLYRVNTHHSYENELMRRALSGEVSFEDAATDPHRRALSEYIGAPTVNIDQAICAFPLIDGDKLLLCSDGVSGALNERTLQSIMEKTPHAACSAIEEGIIAAELPHQDNYTAIILEYKQVD